MENSKETRICPRCKGNGYIKVVKEVAWPTKEQNIVVQCPMCKSEGEIKDVGGPGTERSNLAN